MPGSKSETDLMNASESRHPTDHTLHAHALGVLDVAAAESVSNHLEACSDCRRRATELASDRLGPMMSSTAGPSVSAMGDTSAPVPLPMGALPPGFANHPDYEITRELGRGGMGVVYLAQNRLLGRSEVLKVVSSHLLNRSGVLDRFGIEIRNAARLHHPNIVTAYSAFRIGESLVLAMEYVEGRDLTQMVESRGPLPVAHSCNYAHQAALGLQHAHERGMVHRDIKPGNLMLARENDRALIKVLDFGLAKVRSEGVANGGLTHEGQMLGTPAYIAPEQISNARGADIRADIYSLGCTLYCLLTGAPPFRGPSLYDILQAHHSMEATPLNLKRPEVPVPLVALVGKMMAKEPVPGAEGGRRSALAVFQEGAAGVSEHGSGGVARRSMGREPSGAGSRHLGDAVRCEECGVGCPKDKRRQAARSRNGGERPRRLAGSGTRCRCDTGPRLYSAVRVVAAVFGCRCIGARILRRMGGRCIHKDDAR
jgi:hypothetical protein